MRYFAVVNRTVAEALADHDLAPIDVTMVINTHLHFDHCGQNPAFEHAPLMVQRAEHERIFRERDEVTDWIEASGMRFELVDGEVQLADDLRIITTPGHTSGHQSVVATTESGTELFIGDAAYTRAVWDHASESSKLPSGQAADLRSGVGPSPIYEARKPAKSTSATTPSRPRRRVPAHGSPHDATSTHRQRRSPHMPGRRARRHRARPRRWQQPEGSA